MRVAALILALLLGLLAEGAAAQEQPARPDLGASALVRTGRGWWGRPPPLELRLTLLLGVVVAHALRDRQRGRHRNRLLVQLRDGVGVSRTRSTPSRCST